MNSRHIWVKEKLSQSLGNRANQWKPGTPSTNTTTSKTTSSTFRIKRSVAVAGGIFQLAGFALSLFNWQELSNVKRASEATQTQHRYVVAQAEEALMIAKTQTDLYQAVKIEGMVNEVSKMKRIFISEFTMFLTGFQSLLEGRFSPLLVNPDMHVAINL